MALEQMQLVELKSQQFGQSDTVCVRYLCCGMKLKPVLIIILDRQCTACL